MGQEVGRTVLSVTASRVTEQIKSALAGAKACVDGKVPYMLGGNTLEGMDCSGLIKYCYSGLLPKGLWEQSEALKQWMFVERDIRYTEEGDIVFFAEKTPPNNDISHNGIVERVNGNNAVVIHASETRGRVVRDDFARIENLFRETYFAKSVGKVRLFLFRLFLEEEINRMVKNAS